MACRPCVLKAFSHCVTVNNEVGTKGRQKDELQFPQKSEATPIVQKKIAWSELVIFGTVLYDTSLRFGDTQKGKFGCKRKWLSKKAMRLQKFHTPNAAMCFWWHVPYINYVLFLFLPLCLTIANRGRFEKEASVILPDAKPSLYSRLHVLAFFEISLKSIHKNIRTYRQISIGRCF